MQNQAKKIEILDVAQSMIQKHGFNGFSYACISQSVGIRKSSIHHHFPSKAELAVAIVRRYRETFSLQLAKIHSSHIDWLAKVRKYAKLYEGVLVQNKLCLCGMLASEMETLPEILKHEIQAFFADNVEWLCKIMTSDKSLPRKRLKEISWQIIASLQGAVLLARMQGDVSLFRDASRELLSQLDKII